jgi:hypothetical protein
VRYRSTAAVYGEAGRTGRHPALGRGEEVCGLARPEKSCPQIWTLRSLHGYMYV